MLVTLISSASALSAPITLKLAWKAYSVEGLAYSSCISPPYVYVVGYAANGSAHATRVEARRITDGSLVKSASLGPGVLYSCAVYSGKIFVGGMDADGKWLIAVLGKNLDLENSVKGVKGYVSSLVIMDGKLYASGFSAITVKVRVEKRDPTTLSLEASYEALAPNTYAFASTASGGSLWVVGSAFTSGGFVWRVERLDPNLSPVFILRPPVTGHAYSVSAGGLVFVTGPNGTIALNDNGEVISKQGFGGDKLVVEKDVVAVFSGSGKPQVHFFNATTLFPIGNISLSDYEGVHSFGTSSSLNGLYIFAGAVRQSNVTVWAIYAVNATRAQITTQTALPGTASSNSTAKKPEAPTAQPVQIFDYLTPALMLGGIVLALIMARRKRKRR